MNIASRVKMFAVNVSAGLLFFTCASYAAQYTYVPTDIKATIHTPTGQEDDIEFQQCSKLEASDNIMNIFIGTNALGDIFNIPLGAITTGCKSGLTSFTTGPDPEQIDTGAEQYQLMSLVSLANYVEAQGTGIGSGGKPPLVWAVFAASTITINGVPIPAGSYNFGQKFDVVGPVPSSLTSPGTTTFTGKMTLGEMHALRDSWGKVIGTRFVVVHICGKLTDSLGNKYDIDQNIGQNDVKGVMPNQVTVAYTFIQD